MFILILLLYIITYNILKNDYYNEIMNLLLLSSSPVHFTVCTIMSHVSKI